MDKWTQLADKETIDKVIDALEANGIDAKFVEDAETAKKEVLLLIPEGAEVMTMTSETLNTVGVTKEIDESGKYNSVHKKLTSMDMKTQWNEMRKLGAAADWVVGSVHAVAEDGHVLIASNSGSQLGSYAFAGGKVIWVVGTQKIVKNIDEGLKRIYEYCLPLEDERAKKAYGIGSAVNKILIINREKTPERYTLILVNEKLGF